MRERWQKRCQWRLCPHVLMNITGQVLMIIIISTSMLEVRVTHICLDIHPECNEQWINQWLYFVLGLHEYFFLFIFYDSDPSAIKLDSMLCIFLKWFYFVDDTVLNSDCCTKRKSPFNMKGEMEVNATDCRNLNSVPGFHYATCTKSTNAINILFGINKYSYKKLYLITRIRYVAIWRWESLEMR